MVYVCLLAASILLSVLGTLLCKRINPALSGIIAISILGVAGAALSLEVFTSGSTVRSSQLLHPVFGSVQLVADGLSAWFLAIVSVLFVIGAFYGRAYLRSYAASLRQLALHWLAFSMTLAGFFILLTTDNVIVFLVGWELMAIGSFFAVIFEYDHPIVLKAGLNYFIQSHVAVLIITAVFAWSMSMSGGTSFRAFAAFLASLSKWKQFVAMSLLIVGFGFKAGFMPFHSWLPHAHPAAPSHISALMSGVIVKAGIYGIMRFSTLMPFPDLATAHMPIGVLLLVIGMTSGLYGIVNAAEHRDFKRMLAYCTIENVGIIALALGLWFVGMASGHVVIAALGFAGALLHTLNHAIFKALLFFAAGNVYVSVHTRNMEELGGLAKSMPRTAALFLVGALAIGALPPFGGFMSELLVYSGFLHAFHLPGLATPVLMAVAGGVLAIIGGVSMLAFTKAFGVVFLGSQRTDFHHEPHEVPNSMLWPAYALVALAVAVVLFAAPLCNVAVAAFTSSNGDFGRAVEAMGIASLAGFAPLLSKVTRAMLLLALVFILILIVRHLVMARRPQHDCPTWGCGYLRPIRGIQYTGKSFAKTLVDMCRIFLPTTARFHPITAEEVFPKERSHMSSDADFWEKSLISPTTDALTHGLDRFQFIQNGNLQRYIVYGLAYTLLLVASLVVFA